MILIDSHAHLNFENFKDDLPEVLGRAKKAGVEYIINIAIDAKSILASIDLAEKYPYIYTTVGIHPHEADNYTDEDVALVEKSVNHPRVVAVGEVGLDFHRDYADHDNQRKLFREMIAIAQRAGKPMVIHNRAASEETIKILREENAGETGGVFHCFAGDADFAGEVIKLGFYISYAGNLTYPKSKLKIAAESIPIERVLVETDCPFLAPQPRRGKRCEPADVRHTAETLAGIKNLTLEDTARVTTYNVHRLFAVGPGPESQIVYPIRNSLYVNLTNRCSCRCTFCPRTKNPVVKGYNLKLEREPEFEDVVEAVEKRSNQYDELVFCGYGEPTIRFDLMKRIARRFRPRFHRIRLDTNGHGNLINGRDIVKETAEVVDSVSVSLNTSDPEEYLRLNRPEFVDKAFPQMLNFIRRCKESGLEVTATIVGFPGADVEGSEKLAEQSGVKFRVRKYNELG